jgi:neutral ceramidase
MMQIGVARTRLSPHWGVELAGWGYYLQRTWQRIRDHTAATAIVFDDGKQKAAIIAIDVMYLDAANTRVIRQLVTSATGIPPSAICVACSHSHNTPTAAFIRGGGEMDGDCLRSMQRQAATAAILAWRERQPATVRIGQSEVLGWTYNRTRPSGPVDPRLSVWRADTVDGRPLAAVINFQAHPTVMMSLGSADVSRDAPGVITDAVEAALPGVTALYLQGSCGDVNFGEEWNNPERCHEPGRHVAAKALEAWNSARLAERKGLSACSLPVMLPTRRWTDDEITRDREEGLHRLRTGDTTGWRDNIGRVMVNHPDRFAERYGGSLELAVKAIARFAVDWTDEILKDLDTRPQSITTEVQALRIGDAFLVANPTELFTTLALDLRRQWPHDDLMIAGYANDSIGYLPDQHDIERRTYAANQSPKFKNQFPFVVESGQVLVAGMIEALSRTVEPPNAADFH